MLKSTILLHYFLQASSSETAESKASPGFFSQMLSELAAPLYEEDEQDFLSEDTEPDDEPENPSLEDEMRVDDQADAIYETSSGEDGEPKFASPRFEKSVSENVNSAQTAEEKTNFGGATESDTDQAKGEDQPLPNAIKDGNVSGSLSHSLPHSYSANTENKNPEFPDTHTGEPDVGIDSRLEETSIDFDRLQAEHDAALNTKNESPVEQTDNKEINSQEEEEHANNNRRQSEQDLTVNSGNAEDLNTETSVKEKPAEKEAEIDSAGVNRGRQDPEQQEPRSANSSAATRFDKKQPDHEVGATELSDEALEHLRVKSKPSQVEVPSDALEEEEQDVRKNNKEEADEQEEQQDLRKNNKEEADEQEEQQDLRKNTKEEADEQEMKERMEEQERKFRLEKDKRDAEEKKKALEEQSRNLRLEENGDKEKKKKAMEAQTRKLMLEKEERVAENKKKTVEKEKRDEEEKNKAMKEKARKVRLDKEKKAAEEKKQQEEKEAKQLRLESLKKQLQEIEETEKMEMERLRREEEKEISLKKLSGTERKEEEVNDKVPEDEGTDQEKVNPTQEKGESSEDNEDQEHMKIKGAFDEEEAALKRRLEMLSEERRNFEKIAEEYRVSRKERQQKEQKAKKMSTKHSADSDLRKAATAVSPLSKVKTSHHQGWYMYYVER